ncbi:MAG: translation initiation factor 2 [Clostridia bacterium]|nr:translation initiation factor 2 [Clostridia bacterium]
MNAHEELVFYKKRIIELEKQVNQLRLSRRILMNLIEKIETEKRHLFSQLEKEKQQLRLNNQRYAKWLMQNNYRFMELQANLKKQSTSEERID